MNMPRIKETEVFKFDELSDAAKEKAREWWRQVSQGDNFFAEYVYDDAERIGKILGIEIDKRKHGTGLAIYWSGFSSQGDGASFEGSYSYAKGAAKAIREECPKDTELHRIADTLQECQRKAFWGLDASISQSGRYCHEMTMQVSVADNCHGTDATQDAEETITECMRDFARWIYRQLESAYDYEMSDENVEEQIRCNEYEFTAAGERA
jgi:magnesium-transporting ATPase (P-type)